MNKPINLVCYECGVSANVLTALSEYGRPPIKVHRTLSTYHKGKCDNCGDNKEVTEVRDFFYPDFSLLRQKRIHIKQNPAN